MKILGISEIDNDAGAALLVDGELVGAVNEERFSRQKRHSGFPYQAVEWLMGQAELDYGQLDQIIIAKPAFWEEIRLNNRPLLNYSYFSSNGFNLSAKLLNYMGIIGWWVPRNFLLVARLSRQINQWLRKNRIPEERIYRIDHHQAHAACAYYASGFAESLIVTVDGQGAGVSATVYEGVNGRLKLLHEVKVPHSLGLYYAAATKALGFTPARHEGKVTGLAAYQAPDPEIFDLCRQIAKNVPDSFETPCIYGSYLKMKKLLAKCGPAPFAAAFQRVLEEVLVKFVSDYLKKTGMKNLAVSGGVFANVKLNECVFEIPEVQSLFVFPHMADGGLGYGAAMHCYVQKTKSFTPRRIANVYWGPEFSQADIRQELAAHGLDYEYCEDIESVVAQLLKDKKVVGRFNGRMEFGPRALGNRSILYHTQDRTINDWLNKNLKRTEFMPFAPATLAEFAQQCYKNVKGAEYTSEFMTITFNCTDYMKQTAPACVHLDDTARPQLVTHKSNPSFYKIIESYRRLTGCPSIVNTSFNMHEEPIVLKPRDAIRAFKLGHLDYLAIGKFLSPPRKKRNEDNEKYS